MRIVTDFDGVFTTQDEEAEAVGARQIEVLTGALGGDRARAEGLIAGLREEVRARPEEHGWATESGISCYADEDPYVFHNAVGAALYERGPADVVEALAALELHTHDGFTAKCFLEGTQAWRGQNPSHLIPGAYEALMTFCNAGLEVVIVSNSATQRVESILADMGMERFGAWRPRVLGGARKFVLTPDHPEHLPEAVALGTREVRIRRGHYFDILDEERPDVVIGDVLSLDIALPVVLRDQADWFSDAHLCLKRAHHTPAWAMDAARARGVHVVDGLGDLVKLLRI